MKVHTMLDPSADRPVIVVRAAAQEMIRLFGASARNIATHSIRGFQEEGKIELVEQWREIEAAIVEIEAGNGGASESPLVD